MKHEEHALQRTYGGVSFLKKWGTVIGFLILFSFFSLMRPAVFPQWNNLRNVIEQIATLSIVSAGVTIVMITGDFDLSVGSLASLTGVITALLMNNGIGVFPSILAGLGLGLAGNTVDLRGNTYFRESAEFWNTESEKLRCAIRKDIRNVARACCQNA